MAAEGIISDLYFGFDHHRLLVRLDAAHGPVREQLATPPGNIEARRQCDAHLLAARRALAVGDVRRATAAIESAKKLNVVYGHHDDTPITVTNSTIH